jgi:hypothetical protein
VDAGSARQGRTGTLVTAARVLFVNGIISERLPRGTGPHAQQNTACYSPGQAKLGNRIFSHSNKRRLT